MSTLPLTESDAQSTLQRATSEIMDLIDSYAVAIAANSGDVADGHHLESAEESARSDVCQALDIAFDAVRAAHTAADCPPLGTAVAEIWRPMETAPTDGAMCRLLVDYTKEGFFTALEDEQVAQTIGFNSDKQTGDPIGWQFVGWDWQQDCFTRGSGKVVAWLPFAAPMVAVDAPEGLRHLTPNDARQLLCVRDHLDKGHWEDAMYALTCFADPFTTKVDSWAEIEAIANQGAAS